MPPQVESALRHLCVGAALCHLFQRGKLRGSCGELRLLVYATFANSCSRAASSAVRLLLLAQKRPGLVGTLLRKSSLLQTSEENLQSELHYTGIPRSEHKPERGIAEVSVDVGELGVIPGIVELCSEFG